MTDTNASTNRSEKPVCGECNSGSVLTTRGLCCKEFRETLGRFPTGVTIVTALSPDGTPIGVTISSFNSVSLDPPLILWSLSTNSPKLEAFRRAEHYAVNVLASDQRDLSNRFASRTEDRFAEVPVFTGLGGIPLIEDCCAWFECTQEAQHPGGDHLIFIGHVQRFAHRKENSPLVFFDGAYHRIERAVSD